MRNTPALIRHETRFGSIEEGGPSDILADHATAFFIAHLTLNGGERVAEPGCGTGVLSLFAALAGASEVTGTDIDERSLAAAHANARLNRLEKRVRFLRGNLLDPISGHLDVVLSIPPQKPAPGPFNHRFYGGFDGTDLLREIIDQAADRLVPGGKLWLFHHSLANPRRVSECLQKAFSVRVVAEKNRPFTVSEFENLTPGMMAHLEERRKRGESEFECDGETGVFTAWLLEGERK